MFTITPKVIAQNLVVLMIVVSAYTTLYGGMAGPAVNYAMDHAMDYLVRPAPPKAVTSLSDQEARLAHCERIHDYSTCVEDLNQPEIVPPGPGVNRYSKEYAIRECRKNPSPLVCMNAVALKPTKRARVVMHVEDTDKVETCTGIVCEHMKVQ